MKRCLLLLSIITLMVVSASAQRFSYDVIASVSFDAQTQQYGKIQPLNMRIVKDGNTAIFIGADRYDLLQVNAEVDEEKTKYIEYTAINDNNEEFTIKVVHDGNAEHPVMRDFVLLINNSHIYDWTYYYTNAPVKAE